MNKLWDNVKAEHVLKAIELFDNSNEKYPQPRNTFLIYNKKKYPAKHIRGIAYKIANNQEISKNDYSGGEETARFFKKLGFTVQYTKKTLGKKQHNTTHNNTPSYKNVPSSKFKLSKVQFFKDFLSRLLELFKKDNENKLKTSNYSVKVKEDLHKTNKPKKLNVISQKNALQILLQKYYGHIETEKKFEWLKTPDLNNLPIDYKHIVKALSSYRGQEGFKKSNYQLSCDIVVEKHKLIIEYDEHQHFSEARKITLENYPKNIRLGYSKHKWIEACEKNNAKDNSPKDRDEKRAYYDAVRDIEAYKNGYTLVRIKHGDIDWEKSDAKEHLFKIIPLKNKTSGIKEHKIARIVVTGNEYDESGSPIYSKIQDTIRHFINSSYHKCQFEFIITPGGFLNFYFPKSLLYEKDIEIIEKKGIDILHVQADKAITDFINKLPIDITNKLSEIADYFTIGIDGYNPNNGIHIELVGIYDLKKHKIIHWTGKFYPTEQQKNKLIKIRDLNSHFIELNRQRVLILGCHDLNVYNPRGQKVANPNSWKKQTAEKFKHLCKEYNPEIILHHPHSTDTPNIWNNSWNAVKRELPSVKHFASGIKYYHKNGVRGKLKDVLEKTKKGDVVDPC